MVTAQQFGPQQITTYYRPAPLQIGDMINAILPLMMLAMVFAMVVPMFKGLTKEVA